MSTMKVVYENGVLRPLDPLDLPEGTRLEVEVLQMAIPQVEPVIEQFDEAKYMEFVAELDRIAALPLESPSNPNVARDHDEVLYPAQGRMP